MNHSITIEDRLQHLRDSRRSFADQVLDAPTGSRQREEAQRALDRICTEINEHNDFIYNMRHDRN